MTVNTPLVQKEEQQTVKEMRWLCDAGPSSYAQVSKDRASAYVMDSTLTQHLFQPD